MTDWQPIRTAPKDGKFLGFLAEGLSYRIEFCIWNATERTFMPSDRLYDAASWHGEVAERGVRITHWMPLPA